MANFLQSMFSSAAASVDKIDTSTIIDSLISERKSRKEAKEKLGAAVTVADTLSKVPTEKPSIFSVPKLDPNEDDSTNEAVLKSYIENRGEEVKAEIKAKEKPEPKTAAESAAEINEWNKLAPVGTEATQAADQSIHFAQKPLAETGVGEQKRQDALEKSYSTILTKQLSNRSGGLGLQDAKVNQAIDLRVMLDNMYDPKTKEYKLPPSLHAELALGLARLVSPTGQVGIQLEEKLRQKTLKEGLSGALIYLGFDPQEVGGSTQSVIKLFRDSIDRQGEMAEKIRNKYVDGLRKLAPEGLGEESRKRMESVELGSSFTEYLSKSPDKTETTQSETQPFTVDGKNYNIPLDQVDEFKKDMGIK